MCYQWLEEHPIPALSEEFILKASQARQSGEPVPFFKTDQVSNDPSVEIEDIDIPTRDGKTRIRVYRSATPSTPGPLIVFFHPGGFCFGDYTMMDTEAYALVKRFSCTCISVDYRLAPEHQFPAAAHDAWDSLRWAAANAYNPILSADPLKKGFIVSGISAGGTLAGVVSHLARDEKLSPPLTGVHLSVPGLMQVDGVPEKYKNEVLSFEQNENAPVLNMEGVRILARMYNGEPLSPLHNVICNPGGHRDLPPHYIQVAGLDPVRDNAIVYERELREEYGIRTRIHVYGGQPHGFWMFAPELSASVKYREDLVDGIEWLLREA